MNDKECDRLRAENERLRDILKTARDAIDQAPEYAFGAVPQQHDHPGYWIRDELVDRLTRELKRGDNRGA